MAPRNKHSALVLLSLMALIGLGVLFGVALPDYRKAIQLSESSQSTQAILTGVYSKSKGNRRYARYTFTVNGQSYDGQSDYGGGFGDSGNITIYYLPTDPSYSAINPEGKKKGTLFALAFLGVWNAAICSVFGYTILRFRRG